MSKRQSNSWKALEREAAEALGGERVLRGSDFSISDVDVNVKDLPFLKVDCKYRQKHAHHTLLREIEKKYCKESRDVPVLVTKHARQQGAYATVHLGFLGFLLNEFRTMESVRNVMAMDLGDDRPVGGSGVKLGAVENILANSTNELDMGSDEDFLEALNGLGIALQRVKP